MSVHRKIAEALEKLTFEHREEGYRHHTYDDDIQQYEFVKRGDLRALEVSRRMFEGPTTGRLCEDPVRNYQYLFVASITIACRFCIEGGMPAETAFNLSDLYIRQADRCRDVQAVFALHEAMIRDYTLRMQAIRRGGAYSRLVLRCMEYIDKHLQSPLTVRDLAEALEVSQSYLSTRFKRETGQAVSNYVRRRRVETAKILLQYTEFSCLEIAEYLSFSSDSHFSRVFREAVGVTPREYRQENYQHHWESGEPRPLS